MPKPIGIYAKAQLDVVEMFEAMQAEAMLFIKETFAMEDDSFKIEEGNWEKFFAELERAEREGRMSEFEQEVLKVYGPIIEQLGQQNA